MGGIGRLVGIVGLTTEKGEDLTVVAELRIVHIDGEIRIAVAVSKNVLPLGVIVPVIATSRNIPLPYRSCQVRHDAHTGDVCYLPVVFPTRYELNHIVGLGLVETRGVVAVGKGAAATAVDGVVLRRLIIHHVYLCLLVSPDAVFPRLNLIVAPCYAVHLVILRLHLGFHEKIGILRTISRIVRFKPSQVLGVAAVVDISAGFLLACHLREVLLAHVFPFRNHHFLQFVLRIGEDGIDFDTQCHSVFQYDFVLAALHILLDMYLPACADEDIIGCTYIHIAHSTYILSFVGGGNGFHRSLHVHGVSSVRISPVCLHAGSNIGMYFT